MVTAGTNGNREDGTRAEEYVADAIGGERTPEAWYDVLSPSGGLVEVKSTTAELSSGRSGRFRLWKSQHDKLRDQDGEYWFLVDGRDAPEPVEMTADEVEDTINENDLSWTGSGKHGMDTPQVKIPWTHLIDPER